MSETVENREINGIVVGPELAVNIKTAIPLEKHMTSAEGAPCQALWLNLTTMWRNFSSSIIAPEMMPRETQVKLFIEELYVIQALIASHCPVQYYYVPTEKLVRAFPSAKLKEAKENKTANQLFQIDQEFYMLSKALKEKDLKIKEEEPLLSGSDVNAWIITHHVSDLLSRYRFRELTLLESNTGNTVTSNLWGGKLTGDRAFNEKHIPFNALTLQIMGDRAVDFLAHAALSSKVKKVAEANHWHGLTTMAKIRNDLYKSLDEDTYMAIMAFDKINL